MTPVLVTIPSSHFCEMARWALERARVGFREEAHLPIFSDLASLARGKKPGVPLLLTDGEKLRGSTQIMRWAEARGPKLWPEEPALAEQASRWEERFDLALGPATRRVAYAWLIDEKELSLSLFAGLVPRSELSMMRLSYGAARMYMRKKLGLDGAPLEEARRTLDEVFAEVGAALAGKRYLVGDRFSVADMAFAALSAPVLCPPGCGAPLPTPEQLGPGPRAELERLRATPAGQHALRMFREERR